MTYHDTITASSDTLAVIAHRGDWRSLPENSLAAILSAADLGATVAEVDVRRTADGALVLLHDETALRTTGSDIRPEDATLADLRALRLFAADGTGRVPTMHAIPTLDEALAAARGRIFLDLDLKDPAIAPEVIACVTAAGAADQVDLKFDLRSASDARRLRRLHEETGIAMMAKVELVAGTAEAVLEALEAAPPFMVEAGFDDFDRLAACTRRLARMGTAVWVNTLGVAHNLDLHDERALADPQAVWGRLRDIGIRAVQTDEAAALLAWQAGRRLARTA